MDKNLLQKAKAPMIALIQTKNILKTNNLKTKMKRAFAIFFSLLLALFAITAQAQDFGSPSRAIDECKKPTYVTISEIGTSNATLSWTENGEATEWRIMLNDDDDNLIQAPTNPFTLTNLTPGTEYTVKVTPWCEMEKWSDPFSFTTLAADACQKPYGVTVGNITSSSATVSWTGFNDSYQLRYRAVPQVVFEDGFENDLDNWTVYTQGEAPYGTGWLIQNSLVHSGNYAAVAISYDNIAYNANNWLVSPQLDLQGTMRFWVLASDSYPDQYEVLLSTTGNAIDDFTITLQPMGKASGEWTEVSIDLDNYAGQQGYIAIHHVDYDAYYLIIDDFEIRASTPWTIRNAEETSVEITSLDAGTTYESQIQGVCEISSSDWTDMASFTTESQLFSGGSGTETDPYIIATTDDMDALAALVNGGNSYNGKFFKMTADLDFSGKDYLPIGNTSCGFKGTFNGNGHTISHVIIQSTRNFIGLFGLLESEGSVNGLTLGEGSSIHGFNRVGGIVGHCGGAINGCNIVEGVTIRADKPFVGGIVGDCVGGNVSNCQNRAAVSSNTYACGGIVGILSSGGEVLQCSNYGFVQASENCGGIVGGLVDCSMVTECINEGNISGNEKVGGIVGGLVDCSMVTECINEGSISGNEKVGGIAGFINNQDGNCFCSVSNCLNLGGVSASNSNNLGSISGNMNVGANFNNNYYAGECTVGGINGNDVAGEAMRGYAIEPQQPLGISLEGSIGVFYDGKVYAGENQEAIVGFEVTSSSIVPQCFTLSAGTYTDNGDGTYTITMPAEDITVSDNIVVEFYGTYYEIPCNGGTTATVIYDISYDTLDYVGIEDFEYGGIQYTVTAIADGAFDGCSDLLGFGCHAPQLATIGANAFRNCTNMDNFGFFNCATPPIVGEGAFENVPLEDILLGVPYCSQYDYGQHEVFGQCGNVQGYELCEYNFMGFGGDGLWSNPANWMDANSELCTNLPGEGAQVAIFAECEIDVDVTVESITNANYEEVLPLTVKTGVTLTATEYVYTSTTPGNLIIKDGAQVYHPNTGAQATVEKNITAYTPNSKNGWHLVSSPAIESFAPTADNGFLANEYDLYFYEEPTHHWRNHKPNGQYANFNIEPLKGYLYANSANDTLQLQGTLRTAMETVNFPLSYTDGIALAGFNLVGNPFAHNVTAFTGSNVATEVYRMNETKDEVAVGTLSENNPLKPGEGFFVKATGDEASITFNSRANNAERSLSQSKGRITLEVSENGLIIDRFILKRDGAPLEKFTLNENSTRVYATEGAQDWAVAVIASEAKQSSRTEQPVSFKAAKNGTYTLTVNVENMDLDYLHLIDNMTGADIDLLTPAGNSPSERGQGGVYTFTAKTTDYTSRFRLVFSTGENANGDNDAPFAYINNGNIIIKGTGTLQIIDILGKELMRKELSTLNSQLSTFNFVPGVYVLRLIDGEDVRTQKIVVE